MQHTADPNFLVIGAQRSGTTWLDAALRAHPQIYLPERRKEIHYFDEHYARGGDWYREFFGAAARRPGLKAIGEITPRYLFDPLVPRRIAKDYPSMRLIAILRNPAERAYSQFGMHVGRKGASGNDFKAFLQENPDAFDRGLYHAQLERYRSCFPESQMLVLIFEEVMSARDAALNQVCRFLGLDDFDWSRVAIDEKAGVATAPRFARVRVLATRIAALLRGRDQDWLVNFARRIGIDRLLASKQRLAPIDPLIRTELMRSYEPDVAGLEKLIGRNLAIWREDPGQSRTRSARDLPAS
jgi:hypothetical protein